MTPPSTDRHAAPGDLRFLVSGRPRPQGSKTSRNGRVLDANSRSRPWRDVVVAGAAQAMAATQSAPFLGAVHVDVLFRFAKPSTTSGARAHLPFTSGTPDVDKLLRAVLDALQIAGVIRNDCQVVRVLGEKVYAASNAEGVEVTVVPIHRDCE